MLSFQYALRKGWVYPMADDTKNGILKNEPNNDHRRLQQVFEAFRPAFSCNDKVIRSAYGT